MGVSVGVLDHFNIRTRNLADTVRFYEDVLGLEKGARPNFAFPGAWMYSEGKAVVHLVDISKTEVPGGDLWQIFVNDPNGVMIELNYEAAKEQTAAAPAERRDDVGAR